MTLQDLGDLGDLIGGIAVVITLIYLAVQIRQNTALITAQTVQASVDATSACCCCVPRTHPCGQRCAKPATTKT